LQEVDIKNTVRLHCIISS